MLPLIFGQLGKFTILHIAHDYRCFFAELLTGKPLLPGKDEAQQMEFIFDKCGTPSEVDWPGVSNLRHFNLYNPRKPTPA